MAGARLWLGLFMFGYAGVEYETGNSRIIIRFTLLLFTTFETAIPCEG